jgi:hypothetical protein
MTIGTLFVFLAIILFVIAGLGLPRDGKVQCQWVAFACLCAAAIAGNVVLN